MTPRTVRHGFNLWPNGPWRPPPAGASGPGRPGRTGSVAAFGHRVARLVRYSRDRPGRLKHAKRRRETVAEQLQAALNSRVIIEQAKGKLAERRSVDMDRAFTMLREYARNTNQHLTDVARDFVTGATAEFPPPARRRPQR